MKIQREFPNSKDSVATARSFARESLSDLPPDILDSVVLMISELTTNALIHASDRFTVTIEKTSTHVEVAVADSSADFPILQSPDAHEAHGRGLQIVTKLSDQWGSTGIGGDGKSVWFRVDLHSSANA